MTKELKELTEEQLEYLRWQQEIEQEELSKNTELIKVFIDYSKSKGLVLTEGNFKYHRTIGIVAHYPNIIDFMCSDIPKDKEELWNFSELCVKFKRKPFAEGVLCSDKYMLLADPLFRRAYHEANNWYPNFISAFWYQKNDGIESYIALDRDRIRIDVDGYFFEERDFWYGAQFNEDVESIKDDIVHIRPPMDIDDMYIRFFYNNAYSIDIKWSTKDNIKTFQLEEFKTDEVTLLRNGVETYPVRYIHAEFDLNTAKFRHFDGAIHFYTADEYYARRDVGFNFNNKLSKQIKADSQKLFKLNGHIEVETWRLLTSNFLHANPLINEYFEGKTPQWLEDKLQKIRARNN